MTTRSGKGGPEPVRAAINQAEEVPDFLSALLAEVAEDPGAVFRSDVLEELKALKREDRAAFEKVRGRLKRAGCRVTALDEALGEAHGGGGDADILVNLAGAAQLFRAPDGTAFADRPIGEHRETWAVQSKRFRHWLTARFYRQTGGAPSPEALRSALSVIEAKARLDGPERPVFVRVGAHQGSLYLDLGDAAWRAVQIDATGWRVVEKPPVRFRRPVGLEELPEPVRGGSIDALRSFLNVRSEGDFVLAVAWVLAALRGTGAYPVLVLTGEQGATKSTFSRVLRALVDPNLAPLRALPREERDLFIAATNGHVLAFDNLSGLPSWLSDAFCRIATGAGFAVRQLYTDQDEVLFKAARPVILNGIEDVVTRSDLADRALLLTLEPIPEECRRTEADFWKAFEAERPRILGVLLDALVEGFRQHATTHLPRLPRMADFALWASACETALWPRGTFWSAYSRNRDEALEDVIEADAVASSLRTLMEGRIEWSGTASDLLRALATVMGEGGTRGSNWPRSPRALSSRLRRAAPLLRKLGIDVCFEREGRARTRMIRIINREPRLMAEAKGPQPSAPSAASAAEEKPCAANALPDAEPRTLAGDADDRADLPVAAVRANPLKANGFGFADDADANCAPAPRCEKDVASSPRARLR